MILDKSDDVSETSSPLSNTPSAHPLSPACSVLVEAFLPEKPEFCASSQVGGPSAESRRFSSLQDSIALSWAVMDQPWDCGDVPTFCIFILPSHLWTFLFSL